MPREIAAKLTQVNEDVKLKIFVKKKKKKVKKEKKKKKKAARR